ncbi:1,4-beta-xylanase [Termitidicoccus mucosus]|uniref:Beta-xylanase n=2 Tax=Termitidicoccus mucosus TaxID=1184151 RepID=A0A178ILR3_9BACT|nr:1,4-beta-xylanase [Opitutaceae bacterium TSB47]
MIAFFASVTALYAQPTLRDAFKDNFLVGVAINDGHIAEKDSSRTALITAQFNTITPENVMKWGPIHPGEGKYNFDLADRYVDFGEKHGMFVIGHTLVWHQQTPQWVFRNADGSPADRDTLLARMREHIHTVVGRYRGRIKGWDVVNEALAEDGSLRGSQWREIIGDDYIIKAFQFAHEADPDAELYYNDYSIENPAKRAGAITLLKKLKAAGVHITGVGIQEHASLTWPSAGALDETIAVFAKLGLKVMITELDVDVLPSRKKNIGSAEITENEAADPALNPYTEGLPGNMQQRLARRYAELFGIYLKHRGTVTRVTLWGVTDDNSWLNDWPIKGRTSYPLLFDRAGNPKPAFDAVIKLTQSK